MKKINILHVICGLGVGGAEKVVYDLSRSTDSNRFKVNVLVTGDQDEMLPLFEKNNITVHFLPQKNIHFRPWRIFHKVKQTIQAIGKLHQQGQADILHAHMSFAGIMAALVKIIYPKIKIVFTSHNFNIESKISEGYLFLTRRWRDADILFSKEMNNYFYKKNPTIIANGINTQEYTVKTTKFKKFTFLYVGRLVEQKNQLAIIQPVINLIRKGYDFQVLLAGTGALKEALYEKIQSNELQNHIQLLGTRKDIPLLCNKAHCFLMTSLWEGFPIVLLEAGASQLPVIANNVGSIGSLLENNDLGYLMQDCSEIEQKMQEVLTNYETAKSKGERLKQKVCTQYDLKIIVGKHEDLYTRLQSEKRIEKREERIEIKTA